VTRASRRIGTLTALVLASAGGHASVAGAAPADASILYASVTCAPATKPGRIRCRAVLELPLDTTAARKLVWGELVVVAGGSGVVPLRGRLGVLDAETRDDQRITWSFSVAAAEVGERSLDVMLRGTLERRVDGVATMVERLVRATVKVAP
jgi:hypothetical protein